ncbi:MAG: UDP-N-acetylmuramoyl-tripeptide--D-alanyl-D-alanine ligase [Thermoanaerobaculia bacterium]
MATPIPVNSARFRLDEIVAATGGALVELAPERTVRGVSTDSRSAPEGALFVALTGETFDGHRFVDEVRGRGAVPLVAASRALAGPRIEVEDPLVALGAIARAYVDRETAGRDVPALTVGGAAGKTTTKTLTAAAVAALCGRTLATAGNLNNRIGLPMTLLTLAPADRAIVLECGTSEPGEIAALARIAAPDVATVTNVGVEHSLRLGSVDEIADEEAGLLLAARRAAVANADDPLLVARLARATATRLSFGRAEGADLRLVERTVDAAGVSTIRFRTRGPWFAARLGDRELRFTTALLGETAAMNVAAAVLGAFAMLDRTASDVEIGQLAEAIAAVEAVPGRLRPVALADLLVIDDSYNANPGSVRAALSAAREVADRRGARLILALGDMLELGDLAAAEHRTMLRAADRTGASELLLVGPECAGAAGAVAGGLATPFRTFADSRAAGEAIVRIVRPGDVILVKGSRGIRMENLIQQLEESR